MFHLIKKCASPFIKNFSQNYKITSTSHPKLPSILSDCKHFSSWLSLTKSTLAPHQTCKNFPNKTLLPISKLDFNFTRSVTKFSLKTGKKRSVGAVMCRFYRLQTGLWIRRFGGCHKKLHKKSVGEKWRLQQHVFCTKTQCIMLDKMTTDGVKKKRYYIDDPFEPYQVRNNFKYVLPIRRR